jgi:hypothetical protein
MAIITNVTSGVSMNQLILADSQEANNVNIPSQGPVIDFCPCDYQCEYVNNVFASIDTDEYKNDSTSFLISLSDSTSVLEIRLIGSNGTDEIISDDTYGEYFAKGTIDNTPNQLNYVGFIASWKNIFDVLGQATYYFTFKETVFSQDFEKESVKYRLQSFSDEKAKDTFKFVFVQNGVIENGIDYTGLNWNIGLRIDAKLKYQTPILTLDNYPDTDRKQVQIQDKTIENFEIETYFIPSEIGDLITKTGILSNSILITNYDLMPYKKYNNFDIIIKEISDFKGNFKLNELASFTFSAEERIQNNVKRNVTYK